MLWYLAEDSDDLRDGLPHSNTLIPFLNCFLCIFSLHNPMKMRLSPAKMILISAEKKPKKTPAVSCLYTQEIKRN